VIFVYFVSEINGKFRKVVSFKTIMTTSVTTKGSCRSGVVLTPDLQDHGRPRSQRARPIRSI